MKSNFLAGACLLLATVPACAVAEGEANDTNASELAAANGTLAPGQLDPLCQDPSIQSLLVPALPKSGHGPVFAAHYQVFPGTTANAPTIVVAAGGGALSTMSHERPYATIPALYRIVVVEHRGSGCNALAAPPPEGFYGYENDADDLVRVIRKLELRNYVLFGTSEGTATATIAAHRLGSHDAASPRAVALQAAFGPPLRRGQEEAQANSVLYRYLKAAPARASSKLFMSSPPPLGVSAPTWGNYLYAQLLLGTVWDSDFKIFRNRVKETLRVLETGDPDDTKALVDYMNGSFASSEFDAYEASGLYQAHICRAHSVDSPDRYTLKAGSLRTVSSVCKGVALDQPYDPKNYSIEQPLVYLQGAQDPISVLSGARAHHDSQGRAPRAFVTFAEAGHFPAVYDTEECSAALFAALFGGKVERMTDAAKQCHAATVEVSKPSDR